MDKPSKLLFSLRAGRELIFSAVRGSGAGGQKRNKTASCVILEHPASGVQVRAQDERSQHQNKRVALHRLAETPKFRLWVRCHAAAILAGFCSIEERVERWLRHEHLRVEELITFTCDGPGCGRTVQIVAEWGRAESPADWMIAGEDSHLCPICADKEARIV